MFHQITKIVNSHTFWRTKFAMISWKFRNLTTTRTFKYLKKSFEIRPEKGILTKSLNFHSREIASYFQISFRGQTNLKGVENRLFYRQNLMTPFHLWPKSNFKIIKNKLSPKLFLTFCAFKHFATIVSMPYKTMLLPCSRMWSCKKRHNHIYKNFK